METVSFASSSQSAGMGMTVTADANPYHPIGSNDWKFDADKKLLPKIAPDGTPVPMPTQRLNPLTGRPMLNAFGNPQFQQIDPDSCEPLVNQFGKPVWGSLVGSLRGVGKLLDCGRQYAMGRDGLSDAGLVPDQCRKYLRIVPVTVSQVGFADSSCQLCHMSDLRSPCQLCHVTYLRSVLSDHLRSVLSDLRSVLWDICGVSFRICGATALTEIQDSCIRKWSNHVGREVVGSGPVRSFLRYAAGVVQPTLEGGGGPGSSPLGTKNPMVVTPVDQSLKQPPPPKKLPEPKKKPDKEDKEKKEKEDKKKEDKPADKFGAKLIAHPPKAKDAGAATLLPAPPPPPALPATPPILKPLPAAPPPAKLAPTTAIGAIQEQNRGDKLVLVITIVGSALGFLLVVLIVVCLVLYGKNGDMTDGFTSRDNSRESV